MEQLDAFISSVDPLFDWESFITPPALEEAFKEALKEDNTVHRKRKALMMMVMKTIIQRKKLKGNHASTSHLP